MEQDAPKITPKQETTDTKIIEESALVDKVEVADGPEAAAAAKKRKNKKNKKKKTAALQLDLAATDFVPTASFKFDPVAEPIIPVTPAAPKLKPAAEVSTPKTGVEIPAQQEKKKQTKKVKIVAEPIVVPSPEEKKEESAKELAVEQPVKEKKKKSKKSKKEHNATFNIDAPVFTPTFTPESAKPASDKPEPVQLPTPKAPEPVADFGGYQNRHLTNPIQIEETKLKSQQETAEAESKKVWSLQLMLSLRQENKQRPVNMALLDFPHKKRKTQFRQAPLSEIDKFNRNVGQIRILLNKLSDGNFQVIQDKLLKDFEYTPSLLYELMKIIFMKSTTEQSFMEIYVRLCVTLFKKFNDKENVEMNFRKLLLTRCEKQFYKMLKVEQEDRRSRRTSLDETATQADAQADFNKQMLHVYDQTEIKARLKDQMFGNMHLIVELYKYHQIKSNIITMCIDDMFEEINSQNVEILCQMLMKLATFQVQANQEMREQKKNGKQENQRTQIDLEWIDVTLQRLFKERQNMNLNSRIRFCIQDLIDAYEKQWKSEIIRSKAETLKIAQVKNEKVQGRSRKSSKVADEGNLGFMKIQKEKSPENDKPKTQGVPSQTANSFQSLLSGLRPDCENQGDDSHSEDEDAMKLVDRKISLNKVNVIGLNLERYNDLKPTKEVKRMITNLFLEYNESGDVEHCCSEFNDIQQRTGLQTFVFLGHLLNNAFAMDPTGWQSISTLVLDYFYADRHLFSPSDLIEGVNVSLANFVDMLIDYPNSKLYAYAMFDKLTEMGAMTKDQNSKYKQHCENLENMEYF